MQSNRIEIIIILALFSMPSMSAQERLMSELDVYALEPGLVEGEVVAFDAINNPWTYFVPNFTVSGGDAEVARPIPIDDQGIIIDFIAERAIPETKIYNGEQILAEIGTGFTPVYFSPYPYPTGSYHFITHPHTSQPWGCGHWGITPTYPQLYDDYCLNGNKRVISGDIPDLGIGVAASIQIPANYVVTIYESKNYQGKARTFYKDAITFSEEFYGGSIKIRKISSLEEEDRRVGKNENIISPADIDEILNAHNKYRLQVGVKPLIWDDQIAASAKQWANYLDSTKTFEHSNSGYGENIAWGKLSTWTNTIDFLASEKKCFKNGVMPDIYNGLCNADPNCAPYKDWHCAGHYSQIVWSNTQKVGCGKSGDYWVLQYSPPGNYYGQKPY